MDLRQPLGGPMPDEESFIMRGASCIGRKLMVALAVAGLSLGGAGAGLAAEDDEQIALYLADLLQAGRAVIGAHQDLVNDPSGGGKGPGGGGGGRGGGPPGFKG